MNLKIFWEILKETVREFGEDKASRLAAALAYYTIFSLAPLLVIVIGVAGLLVSTTQVQETIIQQVQSMAGADTAQTVNEMLTNFNRPGGGIITIVVGVVTLILGATGVFGQLQDALNTIWKVQPKANRGILGMLKDRFLSFTMVLGLGFLLLVSLVITTGLSAVGTFFGNLLPLGEWVWQIVNLIISVGVITLLFALIFQVLPDVDIAWKDVWIGALVTSILFNIGKFVLSYYLGTAAVTSGYGAAGSLIVILLWVYYSSQILFFGAEFTKVYARRFGSKITANQTAYLLTETDRAQPLRNVQEAMIPIVGQPPLRASAKNTDGEPRRERIRYEPPNPATVVPVIALGATAGAVTLVKIIRKVIDTVQARPKQRRRRR